MFGLPAFSTDAEFLAHRVATSAAVPRIVLRYGEYRESALLDIDGEPIRFEIVPRAGSNWRRHIQATTSAALRRRLSWLWLPASCRPTPTGGPTAQCSAAMSPAKSKVLLLSPLGANMQRQATWSIPQEWQRQPRK